MSETALSRAIQDALEAMGALVVRVQSGSVPTGRGYMRLAPKGTPDLYVAWRGRQGWLEVKSVDGWNRVTEEQTEWHERAAKHGVRVAVVRSVEEAARAVKGWAE